jgi:hypothetical protein
MLAAATNTKRPDIRVVDRDREHCIAVWDRIVFEIWRGPATLAGSTRMMTTCEELLRSGRGPVNFIAILERTSPPPSEPVRAVLAQWSREVVPRMETAIVVAEGGGFRSSIVRGVCTALTLLAPHRARFKFVGAVEDGLKLLVSPTPSTTRNLGQLRMVVDEVRGLLG